MAGHMTGDLRHNVSESDMKLALEAWDGVYDVEVIRSDAGANGQFSWSIVFKAYDQYLSAVYAEGLRLTGLHASIEVDTQDCPSTAVSLVAASADSAAGQVGEAYFAYLTGPEEVHAAADYLGDGLFEVSYTTPKVGDYNLTVAKTIRGGRAT
jgi:hypothetical protein